LDVVVKAVHLAQDLKVTSQRKNLGRFSDQIRNSFKFDGLFFLF
jgi:hypothetical protein